MFTGGSDPSHSLHATASFVAPCHSPSAAEEARTHGGERGEKQGQAQTARKAAQSRDHEMVSALYSHAFKQVLSYPNNDGVGREAGDGPGQGGVAHHNPQGRIRSHLAGRVARLAYSVAESQSSSEHEEMPEDISRHSEEGKTESKEDQEYHGRDLSTFRPNLDGKTLEEYLFWQSPDWGWNPEEAAAYLRLSQELSESKEFGE